MINYKFNTDVQLINVADKGDLHYMADFPYGMALIAGYLREKGFETMMLQYPTWKKEEYEGQILNHPAYLYGFQVSFDNYAAINALVKVIKSRNPKGKIIFGGPFIATFYEKVLKNDPDLDAVVLGEGEYTTAELIGLLKQDSPDWKLIRGLAWLGRNGKVIVNPPRPSIQDLDAMPFAARDGITDGNYDFEGKYVNDVRITTSRGCTSNCTFCAVNLNSKLQRAKRWRGRSPISVVDEIQELVERYNVKLINLQDSSFDDPGKRGFKRNRIFCEEILKRNLKISMKAYLRANWIKDDPESIELYKLYKEAGIDVVIIGAEAGSDYELDVYGKSANLDDNYRSFRIMNDLDLFFVHAGFIMFGPYSTLSTLRENIQFLRTNQLFYWYPWFTTCLILLPGSAISESVKREGRLLPRNNFWEFPDYKFQNPFVLKLTQHYQYLRTTYPYIDVGSPLMLTSQNIITRLNNKMNQRVAIACKSEIEQFKHIFYRNKNILNELGYLGSLENIERIDKDGLEANLLMSSEPYFGKKWEVAVYEVQEAYEKLITAIESKGFGLGGLVFNAELTKRERQTDVYENMK